MNIRVENIGGTNAYFSYNLYSSAINQSIAALILYAGQFALNFAPSSTPPNYGISFQVKAPTYTQPTSLAIWVAEGGANWDAQVGFTTITTNYGAGKVSYPFFEVFPGGSSAPGGQDYNYPLVPGQTYTFTMQQTSGNTWEFLVDGTLIKTSWPSVLNGTYTFDSSQASQNTDFAIESFVDQGGGMPNVTNPVYVPIAMQFYTGGSWINASSLFLPIGGISENWRNGWVTSPLNLSIWGIQGNLQNSSLRPGAVIFGSSIRPIITSGVTLFNNNAGSVPTTTTPQPTGNVGVTLYTPQINGYTATVNGAATTTSGTITTIQMNWGDGTVTTGWFPFTHTYQSSGQFSVSATAQNSYGASGASSNVNANIGSVTTTTSASTTTIPQQPTGNVDVTLNTPQINGYTVMVNGAATTTSGTISTIQVNWGDGTTTTGWFPFTHTYQSSGSFSLFATAQNSNGAVGTSSNVTVNT